MKQLLLQKGEIILEEVPPPAISDNEVLVKTRYSLISTGTELSGIAMSNQSLLTRAMKQPHHVKKALKMASEKGLVQTYKIIKSMLDFGTPIGYSLAGEVVEVGKNIRDICIGDLVACSGAGVANHAEFVAVPRLLVSRIPDGLELKQAASVTLGAIAMQGVRQANPKLGETVAVIGLGLIGQLAVQILKAAGTRIIGVDPDEKRCNLAKKLGANFALTAADANEIQKITEGFGVDATIITASTQSHEPLQKAMEITRRKGIVVVVGAVGLNLQRNPWYEKEIDLKISCSYGPGRYDPTYEEEMLDYPLPYVRWTENRNMEEYLKLLAEGKVDFLALAPQEFALQEAVKAYEQLKEQKPLAVLLSYHDEPLHTKKILLPTHAAKREGQIAIALIGAGSFAISTHLPNIKKLRSRFALRAVVSKKGTTAKQFAKQYGAQYCTTDFEEVLNDPNVDAVLIATRHNLHAQVVLASLRADKHVFVEKPLALTHEELNEIKNFFSLQTGIYKEKTPILMVGFNRRFSPYAKRIKELTQNRRNPLLVHYRVNAGHLPMDHWTQKPEGGGRIIGEACHFFDFFEFLTGSRPKKIEAQSLSPRTKDIIGQDNFSATISYEDGSVCHLLYTALGNKNLPKEYAEIYCDGRVYELDDYKALRVWGGEGGLKTWHQGKGHFEELQAFAHALRDGKFPIPLEELFSVTETSFEVNKKAHG
ncbi:bi-domain-containing oxidoreductase [Candidatus Peregrinibacteria bacterium]|nr:bi-domain-containing oxidoreductase [Candidatus Peregrinibacteria bacterium]